MTRTEILDSMIAESAAKLSALRKDIEFEERFYTELQKRKRSENKPDQRNGSMPSGTSAMSLPEQIAELLRTEGRSMRARDICAILEQRGVRAGGKRGLLPNVLSALRRRNDLFENASRGCDQLLQQPPQSPL